MKKILIALTAVTAFSGSAFAADLAARPTYTKAPMIAQAPSWTGFYIFGGAGGGVWDANDIVKSSATLAPLTINSRQGGDGWFGTVGAGYDWQFNSSWVAGVLVDGQFGSLRGNIADPLAAITGTEKLRDTYAAGVRLGYLVAPNVLSYVNGGWTGSNWSGSTLTTLGGTPSGLHTNSFSTNSGVFVGGGVENNLNIFGIQSPGWVHEDRIPRCLLRQPQPRRILRCDRCARRRHDRLQAVRSDHQHLAGLPLQLGWPGRREVLS